MTSGQGITPQEKALLGKVWLRHPEIRLVKLFGSRAKHSHQSTSDFDLAVWGDLSALDAAALSDELESLPLPNHFDIVRYDSIRHSPLREHIDRVGVEIFRWSPSA